MKALSLWQPWATAMDIAVKKNETRSWSTSYRGELLIHAAKKSNEELIDVAVSLGEDLARSVTYAEPVSYDYVLLDGAGWLPLGCALCVVTLVDCIKITEAYVATLSEQERRLGNYEPGRFAWVTTNLRRLNYPIEAKGAQGLWTVSPFLEREVRASLVATCRHCGCTHEFACLNGCGWAADGVCTNCAGIG